MFDSESTKKLVRAVLQASKEGVSVSRLQTEFRALCGENIPVKQLGFSSLEDFLRSIPSVVRLDRRMGELICFAAVTNETRHIAELVARQKSSGKSGRSKFVNCTMRFKASNPYSLSVKPRTSLRQPSLSCVPPRHRSYNSIRSTGATGDYRQLDQRLSSITPVEHRVPASQAAKQTAKQTALPNSSVKIQPSTPKPAVAVSSPKHLSKPSPPVQAQNSVYNVEREQSRLAQLLKKYPSGLWMLKLADLYSKMFSQPLPPQVLADLETWSHICEVDKSPSRPGANSLIFPPLPPSASRGNSSTPSSPIAPVSPAPVSPISPAPVSLISPAPVSPASSLPSPVTSVSSPAFSLSSPVTSLPSPKPGRSLHNFLAKPNFSFGSFRDPPVFVGSSGSRSPSHNPPVTPSTSLAAAANGGGANGHKVPPRRTSPVLAPLWNTAPSSTSQSLPSPCSPPPALTPAPPPPAPPPPAPGPGPLSSSTTVVTAELRRRLKELLSKYSQGLWVHALPKLFMDTYKTPFPEEVLSNLTLLRDMCTVEYLTPNKKAILYQSSQADAELSDDAGSSRRPRRLPLPSGLELVCPVVPPRLVPPTDQYPSVLVTDAKNSNAVTIRYVGESYSNVQEAMEDSMLSFYSQSPAPPPLARPVVGQLVAVMAEDRDEVARAQVTEVLDRHRVMVYYVDYGFTLDVAAASLLELHQDFLSVPLQATNVRLAGLEAFSSHPMVAASMDTLAVGTILLMETVEPCGHDEVPMVVLYDTSQAEDVNINSQCLEAVRDKSMDHPLTANVTYPDVCVTNVCRDGAIYCQLPSRGTDRLRRLLEETESIFSSQMTSESLVSRPFTGKPCLARHKGKWRRVEITSMYGNSVIEIFFIDLGFQATVEVTDLREVPQLLIKDLTVIPPQAIRCRLAELSTAEEEWSPQAVLWLREAVLDRDDCSMKILKLEPHKKNVLVWMYLFTGTDSQELEWSINHELLRSELWQRSAAQNKSKAHTNSFHSSMDSVLSAADKLSLDKLPSKPVVKASAQPQQGAGDSLVPDTSAKTLPLPPPLDLPQPGTNLDVFVPVACHPGYFVLQKWQDLHKLVVLMGEMVLYYSSRSRQTRTVTQVQKGEVYAAKIDTNWHRVLVRGILANGLVSVYALDYGKHELIQSALLQPLIEEFRQLPFQAITAQLAGVRSPHQWSEEASMLFRNHVENRALVAEVEAVQDVCEGQAGPMGRRLTVYLVDTTEEDKDLWIHNILVNIDSELSSAA